VAVLNTWRCDRLPILLLSSALVLSAGVLSAGVLSAGRAEAQALPGAAPPPPAQGSPIPQIAPGVVPQVGPGLGAGGPEAPAKLAGVMAVRATVIDGATAFSPEALKRVAGNLTGPAVPLQRVEAARAGLLGLYRNAGYTFTTVDAVLHADGVLHLVVGESQVTEVLLDGNIGPAGAQVLRFLNHLKDVRPLDVASLERWLLLAKDIPGITVRPVLRPAGTGAGALTLVAQVSRQAISGYVTADNRAASPTGPEQALGVVQFNSFTALGERTELSLFGAARFSQVFGQASTEFYAGDSGLKVRLYAGHGMAQPSGPLSGIGYLGETTIGGVGASYPVIRRRAYSLSLEGNFDVIEADTDIDAAGGSTTRLSHDALRVVRLGAVGAAYDQFLGDAHPGANQLTVRLSQGVAAFGASSNARTGADVGFTKVSFDATRVQTLFSPWSGATLALQTTLAGQWSDDVLPLSEKFYLGGGRLGRGFYAGQVTGDRALGASAELQLVTSYSTTLFGAALELHPTLYAFYDWGQSFENQAVDANRRLQSWGIGVRVPVNDRFEVQLEGAHRITRQPGGPGSPKLQADAVFWRGVARF
jgi:hemolysin activation/secretion protein